MIGDAYAGPSPFQDHFCAPVVRSKPTIAPSVPPTCAIRSSPSMIGDMDVPNSGDVVVNSFLKSCRQTGLPLAASNALNVPLMPKRVHASAIDEQC